MLRVSPAMLEMRAVAETGTTIDTFDIAAGDR